MKTFLLVKLSLLPALVFWTLAARGHLTAAFEFGAALGLVFSLLNLWARRIRVMELAFLAFLATGALASAAGFVWSEAVAASFVVQGAAGLVTCALRRPWTADYSAADYSQARETPLFLAINMGMSLLWSVLFLTFAALEYAHAPQAIVTALVGIGALVSILGPKYAVRFMLGYAITTRAGANWKPTPFDALPAPRDADHFDVAIVGAGLGGLTAGALLARGGLRVFIADQHNVPGGYCHSWIRKARVNGQSKIFRFDSGVHDISGAHAGGSVRGILALLGIELDWARMRQSNWVDGALQPVPDDWRDYARELGARHPQSAAELMRFFESAQQIYQGMYYGAEKTAGAPLGPRSVEEMLAFAQAQPLAVRWMDKPFAEFLASFALTPEARADLYRLAGYVTDRPEEMTVVDMIPLFGYYFHGGYYPRGGSGLLGEKLAESLAGAGGEVALKTPVERILTRDGAACGLRLASGRTIHARAVISNADLKRTFLELLEPEAVPAALRAKFAAAKPSTSAFMVHLGLDHPPAMTDIAHVDGEAGLSIGMVATSHADASAAPEGFGALALITLLPYEEARAWFADETAHDDKALRFSDGYEARKRALGDRMIAVAERALPGLSASIVYRADSSPVTFQRYDWSLAGAIYGVAKADRYQGVKSPVRNLWLAGAGNGGPGVEAVMIAGAAVAEALHPGALAPA